MEVGEWGGGEGGTGCLGCEWELFGEVMLWRASSRYISEEGYFGPERLCYTGYAGPEIHIDLCISLQT